jgi:hypothetical protein
MQTNQGRFAMKLPSIQQVVQGAGQTFFRFPFVLVNTGIGTIAAMILIDHEGPAQATVLFKILFAAVLGIPFLLALALTAEKKKWSGSVSLGAQVAGVLVLVAYAFSVPSDLDSAPAIHLIRLFILVVALLFFLAVAPFAGTNEQNGFWHYNKTLSFRFLTAVLYSIILYAGFSVALVALDQLFGINVPGKRYAELWVLIIGLFNTWFFLAGIPGELDSLEQSSEYPKGLKVLAQYILSPLVIVYLVILYTYIGKILLAWDWPQGWVSKLILGFSATGIFSLLLLYPIRDRAENRWIKAAWYWFYIILIPLIVVLPLAVWRRVSQYGITEGRYLALVLGAWLVGIVIYFLASKSKNIKVIPGSLCVLSVLVSFGPWSTFHISEGSQIGRLKELLLRNSILVDGKVSKASATVSNEDSKQISSIISYLHDIHGYERIQPWFQENLMSIKTGSIVECMSPADVTAIMGVEFMQGWMRPVGNMTFLSANEDGVIDIQGYDHMLYAQHIDSLTKKRDFPKLGISYRVSARLDSMTFIANMDDKAVDSLKIELRQLADRLYRDYSDTNPNNIPLEAMSVSAANQNIKVKVYLRSIRLERTDGVMEPVFYTANILYRKAGMQNVIK